jgi:hypothetical protein
MSLKVASFATYLTRSDVRWRSEDFDAMKFVQALKGEELNKWGWVPVRGVSHRLDQSNAGDAFGWFGDLASDYLKSKHLPRPLILVPIPGSSCTASNKTVPRTFLLAYAVATRLQGVEVWDGFRFKNQMMPSRHGGARDAQTIYDNLRVTKKVPEGRIVLIDDVCTQGGHLRAAVTRLAEKNVRCRLAVCAARTVLAPEQLAFALSEQEFEDFTPS